MKRKAKKRQSTGAVVALGKKARAAALVLARLSTEQKNQALSAMANGLRADQKQILGANAKDLGQFNKRKGGKKSQALADRLLLNAPRLEEMARGLEAIAKLSDPVGKVVRMWEQPNGLKIQKVQIPIGVIGFIYESRPNVTSDAAGLCLKSGNAVILRGGSDAFFSNQAIARSLKKALASTAVPPAALQVLPAADRHSVDQMLRMDAWIDLIIPRGGESLMQHVKKISRIPVLKHDKGVCHLFIDASADSEFAERICLNAKVQRPGVCNAIETLLVHESLSKTLLPRLIKALQDNNVEVRAAKEIARDNPGVKLARPADFGKEFLDLILAVKTVSSVDEAIAHIQRYGSNHTESIITQDPQHAEKFLHDLQSSVVLWNASTRFADGGEMGLGAEIGISTTRLHAYGPMGLDDLTVSHFRIIGNGQIRL